MKSHEIALKRYHIFAIASILLSVIVFFLPLCSLTKTSTLNDEEIKTTISISPSDFLFNNLDKTPTITAGDETQDVSDIKINVMSIITLEDNGEGAKANQLYYIFFAIVLLPGILVGFSLLKEVITESNSSQPAGIRYITRYYYFPQTFSTCCLWCTLLGLGIIPIYRFLNGITGVSYTYEYNYIPFFVWFGINVAVSIYQRILFAKELSPIIKLGRDFEYKHLYF